VAACFLFGVPAVALTYLTPQSVWSMLPGDLSYAWGAEQSTTRRDPPLTTFIKGAPQQRVPTPVVLRNWQNADDDDEGDDDDHHNHKKSHHHGDGDDDEGDDDDHEDHHEHHHHHHHHDDDD